MTQVNAEPRNSDLICACKKAINTCTKLIKELIYAKTEHVLEI